MAGIAFNSGVPGPEPEAGCPGIGEQFNVQPAGFGNLNWGDHDCDGEVTPADALLVLLYLADLPTPADGCPALGSFVQVD
jgi:hypothetical protein